MKSQLEKVSSLERKLNIEVPAQEVQAAFDRAFHSIQKDANIKGFRKGKAPIATIRSIYGDKVKQDVVQDLIQTHYQISLNEHKLTPISYPTIDFDPVDDTKTFKFSATFEIRPEINLKNYENLSVQKEKLPDLDSKVNEVLENIRTNKASLVTVFEDRPAQTGDTLEIDFVGYMDGAPFEGGKGDNVPLELGAKTFIPGFEEGLEGARVGQKRTLDLTFPPDYGHAQFAGKPARFEVTVKALKKKSLPELNDEFAKSLGSYEDLNAFKNVVREDVRQTEERRIQTDLKSRVLRELVEHNPVDVPKSLLQEQKEVLMRDVAQRMQSQGLGQKEFEEYAQKWNSEFEKSAAFMIQSSFLIDALAEKYSLYATDDDFEAKLQEYVNTTGIEISRLKDFYGKDEQRTRLNFQITEEKVVAHLLAKAQVKEVEAKDLPDSEPELA